MNTFASCGRQPIRMTGLTFFVIVMWAALLRAATVTPSDAVVTYVVVRARGSAPVEEGQTRQWTSRLRQCQVGHRSRTDIAKT